MSTAVMDDRHDKLDPPRGAGISTPSPIVFWVLAGMAYAVFAPCILIPALQEYRAIKTAELLESRAVDAIRADVDALHRHLDALRQDPLAVARLAQRDLAYRRNEETVVPVDVRTVRWDDSAQTSIDGIPPPPAVGAVLAVLPFSDRLDIYGDPSHRTVIMALSGAVMVAAFILGSPRRRTSPPSRS